MKSPHRSMGLATVSREVGLMWVCKQQESFSQRGIIAICKLHAMRRPLFPGVLTIY